jgi:hypothetical protein
VDEVQEEIASKVETGVDAGSNQGKGDGRYGSVELKDAKSEVCDKTGPDGNFD